jgi:osmoprotectant transport system permease protein
MSLDRMPRRPPILQTTGHDRVLLLLCVAAWLALFFSGFISSAPNRLARAADFPLWQAPTGAAVAVFLALGFLTATAFLANRRARSLIASTAAALLVLACLYAAGRFATALSSPDVLAARQSPGPAFWTIIAASLLALLDLLQQARGALIWQIACPLLLGFACLLFATSGGLDDLSLTKEFISHRTEFGVALLQHIVLVAAALAVALLTGLPLAWLVVRRTDYAPVVFSILNILQTIPSIALFGLLIVPLSALAERLPFLGRLGVSGTGATPAIIALSLYALLPLVRNVVTGFAEVAADVKEAARGLGFDSKGIVFDVEIPLALPALISGLRIVTVQSIGLAAVAALIGAGGLGTFVFEGIGEYALDLVLLGAFPIIVLALVADCAFRLLHFAARRPA